MKKIGFIDLFIDEWHSNNYPAMIKNSSLSDQFCFSCAWEEAPEGGRPLTQWCAEFGFEPASSIEEVVDKSDCMFVLAPDNPEVHERLAELPLKSGKPVSIDKPFTTTKASAEYLFATAKQYQTPLMTSSALRFGAEIRALVKEKLSDQKAEFVCVEGGGQSFAEYSIHQIEMLVMTMGIGAKRVMQCGAKDTDFMLVEYNDGRRATINKYPGNAFKLMANLNGKTEYVEGHADFFQRMIEHILTFFNTGKNLIPEEETIEIMAIVEAGNISLPTRDRWFDVP